ncbi:thiamine pyrophosphate-dependent enzyme [Micromonospora sp. WMMD1120]|uniref:thiamine pyrophosphate-dependent enzyme n=1 Tax=Micromonospora sp. WMMD1120 TaxID=3016106 RepID=UPI0024168BD5|nr:thiamine pyrophosphate-dependent enzyme [Micromonospora sp. WMMD1120]MDG4808727.1 thiamine pyrophosphate-dependent enzyme [Micromonospora sp. WMMD1120]
MKRVIRAVPDACVVSTCGYPSRELYNIEDRPGNLYLLGSMGMAAPIAYGIALARPGRHVVAFDGDGSVAMNLGCLTLAAETAASVIHVVLDNGMHQSTGGQKSLLPTSLTTVARGAGYPTVLSLRSEDDLAALDTIGEHRGPLFVHATVVPRQSGAGRRVQQTPQELVARVGAFLDMS